MMCFTLLCQLGSCGTRFPRISFRERFQEKRCKGRTCVGCGRRRWSSGYHFQKRIVSRWVQTDRHRGALWAPLLLIPLDPCPPAPLQAHHRHWAAESQMCWEYRGHSRITHTVHSSWATGGKCHDWRKMWHSKGFENTEELFINV